MKKVQAKSSLEPDKTPRDGASGTPAGAAGAARAATAPPDQSESPTRGAGRNKKEGDSGQPPEYLKGALQEAEELARQGRDALPRLRKLLDEHPEIWKHYGRLPEAIEQSWLALITSDNLLFRESLVRSLAALRQELGAAGAGPLELLLIEQVVSARLQMQRSELAEAAQMSDDNVKAAQLRLKRLDEANKRFNTAVRMLATIRRLEAGIKIELKHTDSGGSPSAASADRAVAERLRDIVADERKMESAVVAP